jgi:hypothetical protein
MVRNILAVIAAFIAAAFFVLGVEQISIKLYPMPAGVDTSSIEAMTEYVKTVPATAILLVLIGQCLGSFVGGFVTGIISVAKFATAFIYGVIALAMAFMTVWMIPHPMWFNVAALVLPIPLSLIGSRIGQSLFSSRTA